MKRELIELAVSDSQKIMEHYWLGDPEYCIERLDDVFDWTGSGVHEHMHCTKDEWAAVLRKYSTQNPRVYLTESVYYPVETYLDGCVVFGTYIGHTDPASGYLIRERQRVTFSWKVKGGLLRCSSLHISNPMETVQPGESFPFKISKTSWDYVRHQISSGSAGSTKQMAVKAVGGSLHVLSLNDIVYLEAQDRYTIVHSIEDCFTVRACLSAMQPRLNDSFLRVGRSYYVNMLHVKSFDRDSLLLFSGESIPVPARSAAALREEFLRRMT